MYYYYYYLLLLLILLLLLLLLLLLSKIINYEMMNERMMEFESEVAGIDDLSYELSRLLESGDISLDDYLKVFFFLLFLIYLLN